MQTNIRHSIQDYCKKINSWLTGADILSLFVTAVFLSICVGYVTVKQQARKSEVVYTVGARTNESSLSFATNVSSADTRPFGSKNGKTYTYSWCSGSKNIALKNKIYFASESAASATGRTLSKLCKK